MNDIIARNSHEIMFSDRFPDIVTIKLTPMSTTKYIIFFSWILAVAKLTTSHARKWTDRNLRLNFSVPRCQRGGERRAKRGSPIVRFSVCRTRTLLVNVGGLWWWTKKKWSWEIITRLMCWTKYGRRSTAPPPRWRSTVSFLGQIPAWNWNCLRVATIDRMGGREGGGRHG